MKSRLLVLSVLFFVLVSFLYAGEKPDENRKQVDAKMKKKLIASARLYFKLLETKAADDKYKDDKKMLDELFPPLMSACGVDKKEISYLLVEDEEFNAFVMPGGFICVYTGLVDTCRKYAAEKYPKDKDKAKELLYNLVSSVIAHELGHYSLGHSYARWNYLSPESSKQYLKYQSLSRTQEYEADRAGAMYTLRAGKPLSAYYCLFDIMRKLSKGHRSLSDYGTHPKSSQREAALDEYKAKLKRHQATYDDAMILIMQNRTMGKAIDMLLEVKKDFPHVMPLRHLLGVAYLRLWENDRSPEKLGFMSTYALYDFDFVEVANRGDDPNENLKKAVAEFDEAMKIESRAQTQAAAAIALARLGKHKKAEKLIKAALNDPKGKEIPEVLLAQGIVLALAKKNKKALDAFGKAHEKWIKQDILSQAGLFNFARIHDVCGKKDKAVKLYQKYLKEIEYTSSWAKFIFSRLKELKGKAPKPGKISKKKKIKRIEKAVGLELGMTREEIEKAVGKPDVLNVSPNGTLLVYFDKDIRAFVDDADELTAIIILKDDAKVGNLKVGMELKGLIDAVGQADVTMSNGWLNYGGTLGCTVKIEGGKIIVIVVF